ncbi:MAG: amino acid ABC transporter substrate-binding protein [Bermanella sp.]
MKGINSYPCLLVAVFLMLTPPPATSQDAMRFIFHASESSLDTRYDYHWEVLRAALERTKASFGPYIMESAEYMNERRQIIELQKNDKKLTVIIRETSIKYEETLTPVRIPIDKGFIGYRVFLIKKENQSKFHNIANLNELKKFSIGQGIGWGDIAILEASDFKVVVGSNYQGLFGMLLRGRFDMFSRGVAEVIAEFQARAAEMPRLHIEETIALYYPLPTYFWFAKTRQGKLLADRVEKGMLEMIEDGSFDALFMKYHAHIIEWHKLNQRKIFRIDNPFLPVKTPFEDKRLWFYPLSP